MRTRARDEHGNAWSPYAAEGGEPLRCCLRLAGPGEAIVLISYAPFTTTSAWTEVGPVYVHADACDGYTRAGPAGRPADRSCASCAATGFTYAVSRAA